MNVVRRSLKHGIWKLLQRIFPPRRIDVLAKTARDGRVVEDEKAILGRLMLAVEAPYQRLSQINTINVPPEFNICIPDGSSGSPRASGKSATGFNATTAALQRFARKKYRAKQGGIDGRKGRGKVVGWEGDKGGGWRAAILTHNHLLLPSLPPDFPSNSPGFHWAPQSVEPVWWSIQKGRKKIEREWKCAYKVNLF